MSRGKRTILFIVCILLFLLSAPLVVFYYQGYRFDFGERKITQTGAFYFSVIPRNAKIYLDGQLKKKTDFIFGSAFIENLLPKDYRVQIIKEGYFVWEKTLKIKKQQVTEAKNVVLFPDRIELSTIDDGIKHFYISPDEKNIVFEKTNPVDKSLTSNEADKTDWTLELYNARIKAKAILIKSDDFSKQTSGTPTPFETAKQPISYRLIFSLDSRNILLIVEQEKILRYSLIGLDSAIFFNNTGKNQTSIIDIQDLLANVFPANAVNVSFNPENSREVFFSINKTLFEMDLLKKDISTPLVNNIVDYQVFNKSIYYLDESGFVFMTNPSFNIAEKVNQIPFPLKPELIYQLHILPNYLFIQEGKRLYIFNPESKQFEKFFDDLVGIKLSPDFKKAVLYSTSEIWVLFLEEKTDQPEKKAGEMTFLTRFSEPIKNLFWLGSGYLIFSSNSKIKISEIDERDHLNIIDLAFIDNDYPLKLEDPQWFWNQNEKKIFLLQTEKFYSSEALQ